jgi:murein L,D-transpeptidase YafK
MKRCILMLMTLFAGLMGQDFYQQQNHFPRVRGAISEKTETLDSLLSAQGINTHQFRLFLRAFKHEEMLEVWARNGNSSYEHIVDYPFCTSSGDLGPKKQQGDGQIPEGLYHIDRFNPYSNFHLSLGLNYPSRADRIRNPVPNPGGAIFIHGACASIGCISITDDKIKELYLLAIRAKAYNNNMIPIYIFPARLEANTLENLKSAYTDSSLHLFWENLAEFYRYFEANKRLKNVRLNRQTGLWEMD